MNERLIDPDVSNSIQTWMELFQLPKLIEAVGIYPNVSNCTQFSMKLLYIQGYRRSWTKTKDGWAKFDVIT